MGNTLLTVERSAMRGASVPTTVIHLHGSGETRTLQVADRRQTSVSASVELRSVNQASTIFGSAFVYGARSVDLGGFTETIARGAVRKVLSRNPDVVSLFNHNPDVVLGRTTNGTLKLSDTPRALNFEATPTDTAAARDVLELVRNGSVNGSSFAFTVLRDRWEETDGVLLRTVLEMDQLYEVGPVTYPAYPASASGARSAGDDHEERRLKLAARTRAALALAERDAI